MQVLVRTALLLVRLELTMFISNFADEYNLACRKAVKYKHE
jgi:hypothetical protein